MKAEHESAYQPMAVTSQSLMQYFFYNNLMFTYEYIKVNNMEKDSCNDIFIFIFP